MNGNFGYEDKRGSGGGYEERRGGKDAVSDFDVRGKGGSDRGQRTVDRGGGGGGGERRKGEGSERRGGYGEDRREGADVRNDFDSRQRPYEPSEVRIHAKHLCLTGILKKTNPSISLFFAESSCKRDATGPRALSTTPSGKPWPGAAARKARGRGLEESRAGQKGGG